MAAKWLDQTERHHTDVCSELISSSASDGRIRHSNASVLSFNRPTSLKQRTTHYTCAFVGT